MSRDSTPLDDRLREEASASPATSGKGIGARRERQRLEAREAILAASRDLLAESGDGDFSIRGLADACGYSAPTIYSHFGDKPGLLLAVLEDGLEALAAELDASTTSSDPLERLRFALLTFDGFADRHPGFAPLWETVGRANPPAKLDAIRHHLEEPLDALVSEGRLDLNDRTHAGQLFWVTLHGLIALRRSQPDPPFPPELAELAVDVVLRGLVRTAQEPQR